MSDVMKFSDITAMIIFEFKYIMYNLSKPIAGRKGFNMPKTRAGKLLQFRHYSTDAPI